MDLILKRFCLTELKSSFPKNKPQNMCIEIAKAVTHTNLIISDSIPFHLKILRNVVSFIKLRGNLLISMHD